MVMVRGLVLLALSFSDINQVTCPDMCDRLADVVLDPLNNNMALMRRGIKNHNFVFEFQYNLLVRWWCAARVHIPQSWKIAEWL